MLVGNATSTFSASLTVSAGGCRAGALSQPPVASCSLSSLLLVAPPRRLRRCNGSAARHHANASWPRVAQTVSPALTRVIDEVPGAGCHHPLCMRTSPLGSAQAAITVSTGFVYAATLPLLSFVTHLNLLPCIGSVSTFRPRPEFDGGG